MDSVGIVWMKHIKTESWHFKSHSQCFISNPVWWSTKKTQQKCVPVPIPSDCTVSPLSAGRVHFWFVTLCGWRDFSATVHTCARILIRNSTCSSLDISISLHLLSHRSSFSQELYVRGQNHPEASVQGLRSHLPPTFWLCDAAAGGGPPQHLLQALHFLCSGRITLLQCRV